MIEINWWIITRNSQIINVMLLNVKVSGTYSYQWASEG